MTTLLYVQASPRATDSVSTMAASLFVEALPASVTVTTLDLFAADLPEFAQILASAKQKTMFGQALDEAETRAWGEVLTLVEQFTKADSYLFSVPMWNLSIPYKLKQYIDLITHPGLTFMPTAEGMQGLASGRACVVYSRGGDYSPKDGAPDPYDFQSVYLNAWLAMVGISQIDEVAVQRTLAGPEALESSLAAAATALRALAADF